MITKNCYICNKEIKVPLWKFRSYRNRPANKNFFCSRACYINYWKQSDFWKRGKGITKKCEWCEKIFWRRSRNRNERFCGKPCAYEWSRSFWKGQPKYKRKSNPGRINTKYKKWRDIVVQRDRICQICKIDKNLEAHHIKSFKEFPELRYDIINGITLCRKCHFENPNYDPVTTLVNNQEVE